MNYMTWGRPQATLARGRLGLSIFFFDSEIKAFLHEIIYGSTGPLAPKFSKLKKLRHPLCLIFSSACLVFGLHGSIIHPRGNYVQSPSKYCLHLPGTCPPHLQKAYINRFTLLTLAGRVSGSWQAWNTANNCTVGKCSVCGCLTEIDVVVSVVPFVLDGNVITRAWCIPSNNIGSQEAQKDSLRGNLQRCDLRKQVGLSSTLI